MRILWYSNAPWVPTGYGNQTGLICKYLPQLGHQVAVHANYGLMGTRLQLGEVKVYPNGRERYGNDIVQAYADDWQADVIISLFDVWPLTFKKLPYHHTPWIAWMPVDHEQAPPSVVEALSLPDRAVSFSRHGQLALKAAGVEADYIPLGVDTERFQPGDQAEARAKLDLPADKFIVGMVGANHYFPSRKCIPQVMAAFARFRDQYQQAALYLHMVDDESKEGVDLRKIAQSLGLEIGEDVLISDQLDYQLGFPTEAMIDLYRSFDVLVSTSVGEGFGIPMVEAMACGTPVIATDGTSMREIVSGIGYLVQGDPWWSNQDAWQTLPRVDGICQAMELAHYERFNSGFWTERKRASRERALEYDFKSVVAPAWDKAISAISALTPSPSPRGGGEIERERTEAI